jgi:hypothetical protein
VEQVRPTWAHTMVEALCKECQQPHNVNTFLLLLHIYRYDYQLKNCIDCKVHKVDSTIGTIL